MKRMQITKLLMAAAILLSDSALATPAQNECSTAAVGWALSVPDIEQAQRFYEAALDLRLASTRDFPEHGLRMRLLCSSRLSIELLQSDSAEPNARPTMERHLAHGPSKLVVRVASLDASIERWRRLGATLQVPPFDEPALGLRIAILIDPFGNPFQLNQAMTVDF